MSEPATHADPSLCWNCRGSLSEADLCTSCVKIQPIGPETDFFSILGFPVRLTLDPRELTERFHAKSRLFHPDFHRLEDAREQDISLNNASLVNQAFKTLKDPFERALYVLDLTSRHHSPQGQKAVLPPALLMEIMEFKDALEEQVDSGHPIAATNALSESIRKVESSILAKMEAIDAAMDAQVPDTLEKIEEQSRRSREELSRDLEYRKYLKSMERDLRARIQSAAGRTG
jgi:molecular chaperone HscB